MTTDVPDYGCAIELCTRQTSDVIYADYWLDKARLVDCQTVNNREPNSVATLPVL